MAAHKNTREIKVHLPSAPDGAKTLRVKAGWNQESTSVEAVPGDKTATVAVPEGVDAVVSVVYVDKDGKELRRLKDSYPASDSEPVGVVGVFKKPEKADATDTSDFSKNPHDKDAAKDKTNAGK
mgnify:CR=1 FL=1